MKKILLSLLIVLALVGCDQQTEQFTNDSNDMEENIVEEVDIANEEVEEEVTEDEMPIHPDEITADITILEPDSIGTVYMEATYTNNSQYPITSYTMTILLKDSNERTYLSNHDTVLPGETSPNFSSFGPETQDEDDYEILTLDVTARTEEGNTLYIDYDFKLEEASWWEASD